MNCFSLILLFLPKCIFLLSGCAEAADPLILPPANQKSFDFLLIVDYRQTMSIFPKEAYSRKGFVNMVYYNPDSQEYLYKPPFMNLPCNYSEKINTSYLNKMKQKGWFIFGDGRHVRTVAVNGSLPGPTLVVNQGAEIAITFKNNLLMEGITVHMHGLRQLNNWFMDGVGGLQQCPIPAGSTFTYRFHADNAGTHWYHGHLGSDRSQGIYGPLIVLPNSSTVENPSFLSSSVGTLLKEPIAEFVATVADMYHSQPTDLFHESFWFTLKFEPNLDVGPLGPTQCYGYTRTWDGSKNAPNPFLSVVIHGVGWHNLNDLKSRPWSLQMEEFAVEPGNSYLIRFINAGMILRYRISIESHKMYVVSSDGEPIQPAAVDYLIIFPGERYDVLINADQKPDVYYIRFETMEIYNNYLNETLERHFGLALLKYTTHSGIPARKPNWALPVCTSLNPCTVLNCPFGSFEPSLNLTCLHLQDLTGLSTDAHSDVLQSSYSNGEGFEEHFLNINYYQKVNGWWFQYPAAPPYYYQGEEYKVSKPCSIQACKNGYGDCICTYTVNLKLGNVVQMVLYNEGKGGAPHEGVPHPVHIHGRHFYIVKQGWGGYDGQGFLVSQNHDLKCNTSVQCFDTQWSQNSWRNGNIPQE